MLYKLVMSSFEDEVSALKDRIAKSNEAQKRADEAKLQRQITAEKHAEELKQAKERIVSEGLVPSILGVKSAQALTDFWAHIKAQGMQCVGDSIVIREMEYPVYELRDVVRRNRFGRVTKTEKELVTTSRPEVRMYGHVIGEMSGLAVHACDDFKLRLSKPVRRPFSSDACTLKDGYWEAQPVQEAFTSADWFTHGYYVPTFVSQSPSCYGEIIPGPDYNLLTRVDFITSPTLVERLAQIAVGREVR